MYCRAKFTRINFIVVWRRLKLEDGLLSQSLENEGHMFPDAEGTSETDDS